MKLPYAWAFHLKCKETNLSSTDIKKSLMSFSVIHKHALYTPSCIICVAVMLFSWWLGFVERARSISTYRVHLISERIQVSVFQIREQMCDQYSREFSYAKRCWQWISSCLMCGHVPSDDITCGSRACTRSAMFGILLTHACPRMSERLKKKELTTAEK